jgi:hypothetical protein
MFDWIPLIGDWAFWQIVGMLFLASLFATVAIWVYRRVEISRTSSFDEELAIDSQTAAPFLISFAVAVLFGIVTFFGGVVAVFHNDPIPSSSVPAERLVGLESVRVSVGDGCFQEGCSDSAELLLYGRYSDRGFTPVAYRMRTSPGDIGLPASWSLGLPKVEGRRMYDQSGAVSADAIRQDGEWQGGLISPSGTLATGETLEVEIILPGDPPAVGDQRDFRAVLPITF